MGNSHPLHCLDQKTVGFETRIFFSFLFSAQHPVRTLAANITLPTTQPISHFQLPRSMCMSLTMSMIGGYRTLLVMNLVNPLLIPLGI